MLSIISGIIVLSKIVISGFHCNMVTLLFQLFYFGWNFSHTHVKNPFNPATLLIRPDFRGPLVAGLTHCTCVCFQDKAPDFR